MALLQEIQDAAVDSKVDLSTLLRKCKVLAARLANAEFKQWVENELNGYHDRNSLPDYRIIKVHSKGHFSGPFQSGMKNADMPLICIQDGELREALGHSYLGQSVASMQALVGQSDSGIAREPWDSNLVALFGEQFYHGMNCLQAWKVIPIAQIVGILDVIRNKILNFALEIEAQTLNTDEALPSSHYATKTKIQQIFNTHIGGIGEKTTMRVFISHSSADKGIAEDFVKLLRASLRLSAKDIRCTSVDGYRLPGGADASEQLRQEVFESDIFIALLSPISIQSIYVMFELGARWGAKKLFIPILVKGLTAGALRAPLSAIHAINGAEEGQLHSLLEQCRNSLSLDLEPTDAYLANLKSFVSSATAVPAPINP